VDIWNPATSTLSNLFSVKTANGYVDAGTFNANAILSSSVYKNIKGTVTVTPVTLTIAGVVANKTYDGATTASLNTNVANNGLVGLAATRPWASHTPRRPSPAPERGQARR